MQIILLFAILGAIFGTALAVNVPRKRLNTGATIPAVGLGTWNAYNEELENALDVAFEAGYRLIDCAPLYLNEPTIGKVINRWLDSGKMKREDLFIITKIPPSGNHPGDVARYLNQSLTNLKVDYIDLLLDHVPFGFKYVDGNYFPMDENHNVLIDSSTDINAVWKAMEEEVRAGRVKNIGLSNYNQTQIERIIKHAEIKPAAIEVEVHAYFQQKALIEFCKENGIQVIGYSPLGSPRINDHLKLFKKHVNNPRIMEDPIVKKIAQKYKKTSAQILVRHAVQRDVVVIPKSVHPEWIRSNIDVFDFKLCQEDMNTLNNLDRGDDGRFWDFVYMRVTGHPEFPFTSRINATYYEDLLE